VQCGGVESTRICGKRSVERVEGPFSQHLKFVATFIAAAERRGQSRRFDLAQSRALGEVVSYRAMGVLMDALQAMLPVVIGTAAVLALASIPWRICREGLESLATTRYSLPSALCACFVALAGIAFVGSTALLTITSLP
jgi:hypothetical protein